MPGRRTYGVPRNRTRASRSYSVYGTSNLRQARQAMAATARDRIRSAVRTALRQRESSKSKRQVVRFTTRRAKKPKKRTKLKKLNMHGAIFKREQGGIITDPDMVYVGHSDAPNYAVNLVVWMAVIRKLLAKAGLAVSSFEQTTNELGIDGWAVDCYWHQTTGSTVTSTYKHTFVALQSLLTNVENIASTFATGTIAPDSILKDLTLTDTNLNRHARMSFGSMNVHLRLKSLLCIQNRTLAKTTGTADESNVNDVAQNPLYGLLYKARGSGFVPKWRDAQVQYESFMANKDSGMIIATAANSLQDTKKPPAPGYFERCKKYRKAMMTPGVVKRDYISDVLTMSFNTYWKRFNLGTSLDGTVKRTFLGTAHMYALEKLCNTRETGEPDVTIGYEISLEVGAVVSLKAGTFCPAITEIT
jgi:hypothetical protein